MHEGWIISLILGTLIAAEDGPSRPPEVRPKVGDRVVFLHERPEVTHVVATRRPRDLRSKEILVGDGVEVGDVGAFFRSSKVPLAAIPVGTAGAVREVIEPWRDGNEQRAARVRITTGPLAGQEWWVSAPGLAVPGTPEGDRRLKTWRLLIRAGKVKDPENLRAYVSPESSGPRR